MWKRLFSGFRPSSLNDKSQIGRLWLLGVLIFFGFPHVNLAVLFYSTGDPSHNTNAPGGALVNSGWQYQGAWGAYLGTPVAPKYFLTASHVGGAVGDHFHYQGVDYTTTALFDDPNSDLRLWRICGTFPDYASLYSSSNEITKPVVVFGRGTQRGAPVAVSSGLTSALKGWLWGPSDSVQRWGTNAVTAIIDGDTVVPLSGVFDGPTGDLLKCDFDAGGDEAHLSVGDSAGAVFIQDGAIWKLAGINYAVDGPYNTSSSGSGFFAAVFDEGGLYKYTAGNWVMTPDAPVDVPGGFYATRVSVHVSWITNVLQAPSSADPIPVLQSAPKMDGPYEDAGNATVDTGLQTVSVPVPVQNQFYRLRACDLLRITGIRRQGSNLVLTYQ